MKDSDHRRLMGEIAAWQAEGLIDGELADRLRARYPEPQGKNWALIVTAVFGSLLIGLGIILLLAYNWDELNRPARALLAYLPLLAALGLGARVVLSDSPSPGLREGTGAFLSLAAGAALALVAQTYQLGGTFRDLTLAWMLIILPAAYVLDTTMAALIYLTGITGWAIGQDVYDDNPYGYWLLFAGIVPYVGWCLKRDRDSVRGAWLMWGLVLSLGAAVATGMHGGEPVIWFSLYAAFFTACLLAGELWGPRDLNLWGRPLTLLGGGGLGVMVFLYSFIWFWKEMAREYRYYWRTGEDLTADLVIAGVVTVLAVAWLVIGFRRLRGASLRLAAVFPVASAALVALNFALPRMPLVPAVLMNLYAFALGLLVTAEAVRESRLGRMNLGLVLLAALLAARFFDADMSILGRGLVFIALGSGFLAANFIMIRRRRRAA